MIAVINTFSLSLFQERFKIFQPRDQICYADVFFDGPIEGNIDKWAAHVLLRDIASLNNKNRWPHLSQITYDLMRFRGLDPDIVTSLMTYRGRLGINDTQSTLPNLEQDWARFSLSSSRPVIWIDDGELAIENLMENEVFPISTINGSVGRPLKSLLRHPVLDQHDLVVQSYDIKNDKITLGKANIVSADELLKRAIRKLKRKADVRKVVAA